MGATANPTLLRVLVTRRHLQRYESFLPRFEEAARVLADREREPRLATVTVGKRQYERWLSGKVNRPHPDACRVLEHMFSYSVDELFGAADETSLGAATPHATPATTVTPLARAQPGVGASDFIAGSAVGAPGPVGDDDMQRRTVLRALVGTAGAGLTAPALEAIEAVRRSMDATLTDDGGLELLEEWERRVDDYTRANQVTPPANLLQDALLDFADVRSALQRGQYGAQRERLWRLSAQLAGMIGVWLYVLGQHRDARSWFHTGRRAAELCDDARLRAWMYVRSAHVSLHYGTPTSALQLADKAAALHRRRSGTAVRTHLVRARALARLGDRVNARTALDDARAAFDVLDDKEKSDKLFGHTERQFLAHAANAMTSLRDTKAAERLRDEATAAFKAHSLAEYVDPVLAKVDEALCMLWTSDPGGASRHVMDVLATLPAGHRTGLVRVYVSAFVASLTPDQRRLRAAAELQESLRSTFAGASAA